jgi:hypothetical protein
MQQVGWRTIIKGLVKGFQQAMRGFSNTALVASALRFYCPESRLFITSPYLQVKQGPCVGLLSSTPAKRCDPRHEVFERIFFRAHQG